MRHALLALTLVFGITSTGCIKDPVGDESTPQVRTMVVSLHPAETNAGKGFNVQPDGNSAIAIAVRNLGAYPKVVIGDRVLDAAIAPDKQFVTTIVPAQLYAKPGTLLVFVRDSNGESNRKEFNVRP